MKRVGSKTKRALRRNAVSYMFLAPWLIIFTIFVAYPFFYGFAVSFFEFNYVEKIFIGFENYKMLFTDKMFIRSIFATFKMVVIIIPGTLIFSLWVAHTISNRSKKMQSLTKIVFYLSAIVSEVALVIVWKWVFNPGYGLSATITDFLGISRLNWFGNINLAIPLVSTLVLSFTISQPIILYSAAMNNIPVMYYESAEIDGASSWMKFAKITWPLIRPTTTFILITTTIANLQIFAVPYLLTAGGPEYGTTTILLMIYRNAFEYSKYGYASAMGIVLFLIIALFATLQFKFTQSDIQY
ncbi:MAG: sugar ABC transporter permease [Clostridiaceae bacterium]|nr:sugar ABC transporter permease [Clostridiaceae bacterium]